MHKGILCFILTVVIFASCRSGVDSGGVDTDIFHSEGIGSELYIGSDYQDDDTNDKVRHIEYAAEAYAKGLMDFEDINGADLVIELDGDNLKSIVVHIDSVRTDEEFYEGITKSVSKAFNDITKDDILILDFEGNILGGSN